MVEVCYPYNEKVDDLLNRMEAHNKYSKYEINDWILRKINLEEGDKILDVGCGIGKQTVEYSKEVGGRGVVIGLDISKEIVKEATRRAHLQSLPIKFIQYDANNIPFPFEGDSFNRVSCCFAIYYLKNIEKFLSEVKRLLTKNGLIFIEGPTINNATELLELIGGVANKKIPRKYEERMYGEVIPLIKSIFDNVEIDVFKNTLVFTSAEEFLSYCRSSRLFNEYIKNDPIYNKELVKKVGEVINKNGKFKISKEVFGIVGYK